MTGQLSETSFCLRLVTDKKECQFLRRLHSANDGEYTQKFIMHKIYKKCGCNRDDQGFSIVIAIFLSLRSTSSSKTILGPYDSLCQLTMLETVR